MNLIEALKQANGKPVKREGLSMVYSFRGATLVSVFGARETFCPSEDWLLADDWYVVEPKSKIEEAIEREVDKNMLGNRPAMLVCREDLMRHIARIVNLALDEAKKAAWGKNISMCDGDMEKCVLAPKYVGERIDAIKVKE